jgi:hypothetical protein
MRMTLLTNSHIAPPRVTRRFPDWPERLAKFLESRRMQPKKWGYNDCGLFCADAIEAMTGLDVTEELRGHDGPARAIRALARYLERRGMPVPAWRQQPDSLLCEVARLHAAAYGFEEIHGELAQRGDAVILDISDLPQEVYPELDAAAWTRALGIIGMEGLPVTAGLRGTVNLGSERITRAWRI